MRTCRLACWAAVWLGAAHSQGRSGQEPGEPGAARRRGQEQGYDEELDLWINFAPSDAEEVEGHLTDAGALFDENRLEGDPPHGERDEHARRECVRGRA